MLDRRNSINVQKAKTEQKSTVSVSQLFVCPLFEAEGHFFINVILSLIPDMASVLVTLAKVLLNSASLEYKKYFDTAANTHTVTGIF